MPAATIGTAFSDTLAATGGTLPYTWSAAGLPSGLGISATGKISGTPTAAGTFHSEVDRDDHNGEKATATLKLSVITNIPKVTTSSLPSGKVGAVNTTTLGAHGGAAIGHGPEAGFPRA